jgi:NADH:ubiquinone oxidoreductase subunit 2 (subunit N)
MTVGNVTALLQQNLKRMLAYSASRTPLRSSRCCGRDGRRRRVLSVYAMMNLGAFGCWRCSVVAEGRFSSRISPDSDSSGELLGLAMGCSCLAPGHPPTAGFMGKIYGSAWP